VKEKSSHKNCLLTSSVPVKSLLKCLCTFSGLSGGSVGVVDSWILATDAGICSSVMCVCVVCLVSIKRKRDEKTNSSSNHEQQA